MKLTENSGRKYNPIFWKYLELSLNNEKYLLQFSFGHDCSGNDLSILWRWKKISFADLQRDKDKTLLNCKGN